MRMLQGGYPCWGHRVLDRDFYPGQSDPQRELASSKDEVARWPPKATAIRRKGQARSPPKTIVRAHHSEEVSPRHNCIPSSPLEDRRCSVVWSKEQTKMALNLGSAIC